MTENLLKAPLKCKRPFEVPAVSPPASPPLTATSPRGSSTPVKVSFMLFFFSFCFVLPRRRPVNLERSVQSKVHFTRTAGAHFHVVHAVVPCHVYVPDKSVDIGVLLHAARERLDRRFEQAARSVEDTRAARGLEKSLHGRSVTVQLQQRAVT